MMDDMQIPVVVVNDILQTKGLKQRIEQKCYK